MLMLMLMLWLLLWLIFSKMVDIDATVGVSMLRQKASSINVFYGMRQGKEGTKVSD